MAVGQLWLFPPPRPLVERFGEEFFRALPTTPGVYLMCGEAEGVLHVGKALNLRKRLSSYRVAKPALWLHSSKGGFDAVCSFIQHLLQQFDLHGRVRNDSYGSDRDSACRPVGV